jgi:hypothetical protein
MITRSWDELKERHTAAPLTDLSASMQVTDGNGATTDTVNFWCAPAGRWRIESAGTLLYLRDIEGTRIWRTIAGELVRQDDDHGVELLHGFNPLDLLGPGSLLNQMSATTILAGGPTKARFDSRPAWVVEFTSSTDQRVDFTVDEGTGVLVRVHNLHNNATLQVSRLITYRAIPEYFFRWTGPAPRTVLQPDRRRQR